MIHYEPCLSTDSVWSIDGEIYVGARAYRTLTGLAPVAAATSTTNPVQRWIASVDFARGEVRVVDSLGGAPGPWEPLAAYTYPHGAYPGLPANPVAPVATSTFNSTGSGLPWFAPGYIYVPPTTLPGTWVPDPEPPTEHAQPTTPESEWCCGGTCLRSQCEYHGPDKG